AADVAAVCTWALTLTGPTRCPPPTANAAITRCGTGTRSPSSCTPAASCPTGPDLCGAPCRHRPCRIGGGPQPPSLRMGDDRGDRGDIRGSGLLTHPGAVREDRDVGRRTGRTRLV